MNAAPAVRPALRSARPQELDRLVALYQRLAEHHESSGPRWALRDHGEAGLGAHLAEYLREADAALLVAERAGDIEGFVAARVVRRPDFFRETERLEIEGVFVRPERRRGGVGRALVEAALAALDPAGRLSVSLAVARGNREGEAFWRALGFETVVEVLERRR